MSKIPKLRFKEFIGGWEEKKLSELGSFKNGLNKSKEDFGFGYPFINLMDVFGKDTVVNDNLGLVNASEKDLKLYNLIKGDVLFIRSSVKKEGVGLTSLITEDLIDTTYSGFLIRFRNNVKDLDFLFKKYCFKTKKFRNNLMSLSTTSANTNINQESLNILKLNLPSKNEQEKIASFLTSVDAKIQQLTKKESLLQDYKKGVIQKIFNQEIRFKDDDGSSFPDWQRKKLNKYLVEYKSKSTLENEYPVLTSSNKGLILQSDYFGENRLTERANIGLNIIPENFLTYRSRSDNRIFTFNRNTLGYTGLISTYYPVFECKDSDSKFIITLLNKNKDFIGKYSVGTSQTVLSFNELKNIKLLIPIKKEQVKISDFLSIIDKKIELANIELEKTKEFKKALLQQMFV